MIMDENEQDPRLQEQDATQPVHAPTRNVAQGEAEPTVAFAQSVVPPAPAKPASATVPTPSGSALPSTSAVPSAPQAPRVPPMPLMPSVRAMTPDQPTSLGSDGSGIVSTHASRDAATSRGDAIRTDTAEPSTSQSGSSQRSSRLPDSSQAALQQSPQSSQPQPKPPMLFPQADDAQGQQAHRPLAKPMFTPLPGTQSDDDNLETRALWPSDPLEASSSSKRTRGNRANVDGHGDGVAGPDGRAPEALGLSPANATASGDGDLAVEGMDKGLARLDPLTVRPRLSSRILCVVFGLLLFAAAAGVWWLGVRTANGQNFDDEVWLRLNTSLPSWLRSLVHLLAVSSTVIAISVVFALVGIVVAAVRKRWWLLGQLVVFAGLCYGSSLLKGVLPRPYLQNINSSASNTAPSGHTLLAAAAVVVLVCAVPRAWRAACAAVGSAYTLLVALSLVAGKWHRPTDVVMSLLIVGGWALLVLACTRTSGMDEIGTRSASASIQIVGSVMITGGIMVSLYGTYLVWQIEPGLSLGASWTQSGACAATIMLVCGVSMLVFGLVLAMRQLTASPLTKLGLVGAPPAPPSK